MRKTPIASTYVIGAGKALELSIDSDYFRCLEADGDFTVSFDHGPPLPWAAGMSYRVRPLAGEKPARIGHVRMENAGAADVTVTVVWGGGEVVDDRKTLTGTVKAEIQNWPAVQTVAGTVDVGNFPASFQVSNFPAVQDVDVPGGVNVNNFPAGFNVNNFPAEQAVRIAEDYTPAGANFFKAHNLSGVAQLILPGANANGLIVRTASLACASNSTAYLVADTSAPADYQDNKRALLVATQNTANAARNIYVPPGNGLWVACAAGYSMVAVTWDTL